MGFEQIQVELQDVMGDDRRIAESAWTSSMRHDKKDLRTDEDVARVVRMLGGSKPAHGVPFESVVFYFWIGLPISSDRQYVTHRIQSMNGMSGRYRTMPEDWFHLPEDVKGVLSRIDNGSMENLYEVICEGAHAFYRNSVNLFRAELNNKTITLDEFKRLRETFRNVLPQGSMTERTATINLRSFANFQKQRNDGHAQPEIRHIAQLMLAEVEKCGKIPVALEVLKENGWVV